MAFDVQTLTDAARCAECLSPNQKQNVLLYLLNGILENGAGGGSALHNLLSLTHPDTVPGPPLRGSLVVGNATPDWEALTIGAAGRFLGSDGLDVSWTVLPGAFTGFANPTAQVGLVAVNGVATTAMRSDAAPALSQAIAPTWTGPHIFSPAAALAIQINPFGAAAGNTSELRFLELAASGTNYTGFKAADAMAASEIYVLPDAAPSANRFLRAGAVAAGVSTLSWAQISLTADVTGILPVANGGTGTSTAFTQGSVIFAGVAGVFTEDNPNFFWDDTNNRLGIGTITPTGYLELSSNLFPSNNALVITLSNDTADNFPNILYKRSRGTVVLPTAVMAGDRLGGFGFRGYGATGYFSADNAVFRAFAAENFTNTTMGTYFTLESTPIGSTTRLERFRVDTFSISMPPTGTAVGRTNELRFLELAASGTNYTGFRASDAMAASEIYVLPNAAPAANRFLQAAAVAGGVSALSWAQVSLTADVTGILPVANGGSGTSTAFTQGSVIFAGAAGVYSQDNANFFWDDTNNWLGLGIAVPLARLHVVSSAAATIVQIVRAAAAQSANLTEWQSSAATVLACVDEVGYLGLGISQPTSRLHILDSTTGSTFFAVNHIGNGNGVNVTMASGRGSATSPADVVNGDTIWMFFGQCYSGGVYHNSSALLGQVDGTFVSGQAPPSRLNLQTNLANSGLLTRLTINGAGDIGIGIGGAANPLGQLQVSPSSAFKIGLVVKAAGTSENLAEFRSSADAMWLVVATAGNIGVRVTVPSAYLHLAAGTTAASTAPLKLNTGTSMTTAEPGAMEFTTDDLFFTITTGAERKRLLMADATAGLTSGKIPIATTNGRLIDLTASAAYTLTNGTIDRTVDINATSLDEIADLVYTMWSDLNAKGILG